MWAIWSVAVLFISSVDNAIGLTGESSDFLRNIVELRAKDTWNLEVRWKSNGNHSSTFHGYEVQIGRSENFTVVEQKNVSKEALEAGVVFHTWVWTSELPLECADHSARVRCLFNSSFASSWSRWETIYGLQHLSWTHARLFPKEKVLREGVSAVFCCIPADGANITTMKLANKPYRLLHVDRRVRAIRSAVLNSTMFGLNFICQDSSSEGKVLNYVSFPPERPHNLSCETNDLRTVVCSWTPGRRPNLSKSHRRNYTLRFKSSDGVYGPDVPCDIKHSRCVFNMMSEQSFYNISVVVRNTLGEERQNYAFNISDRVIPVAGDVFVLPRVTDAEVSWELSGNFSGLQFSCRIKLKSAAAVSDDLQVDVPEWKPRLAVHLQRLQPSCQYSVTLCCGMLGRSCGPTTTPTHFSTDPLVTLDIWRKIEGQGHNRSISVLWKTINSGPDSIIQRFEVCVEQKDVQRKCVNVTTMQADLPVGPGVCDITVRALTHKGLSIPGNLTVPPFQLVPRVLEESQEKRIMGNADGFLLSWPSLSSATCGYNIEWCMMGSTASCDLQWNKVPANQTSLFLTADGFRKGCRYTFRIFSCHTEGHHVHEIHIGYLEEQKPVQCPELNHSLSVSWNSVKLDWSFNEEDPAHPGFITGYIIIVYNHSTHSEWSVSVDRPDCKSVEVAGLEEHQQFSFSLSACTRAGCGPSTIRTITTLQNPYLLLAKVLTPLLVLIGCFLCIWPCRKTLKDITVDVFSFPSDHTMKVLELDGDLYEVSEKLRSLRVEECKCCDLEIVEERSTETEKSRLLTISSKRQKGAAALTVPPEHSPVQPGRTPSSEGAPIWGELAGEAVTGVMNLTYLPSPLFPQVPVEAPESPGMPDCVSDDTGPSSTGYVTSVTMVMT